MPQTYFDSELTGQQIESALEAISGVIAPENNGKVLAIENGAIVAKSASEWTDAPVLEPLSVTANGDYTPPTGTDGFDSVHVAVPSATLTTKNITQNGTYNASQDNADGYSSVTVNVSGGGGAVVQPLSVTQNGTYNPPSGVDGYAPVTVNVSGGGGTSGVSVGTAAPLDSSGADGDVYIKYADIGSGTWKHTYAAEVTKFKRGTSDLNYVSAAEIDLIFDDGAGGEVSIRDISDFSYSAKNGNGINYTPSSAFDNKLDTFNEYNPTPVTWYMAATVPSIYTPKTLRVVQRNYASGSDVWSTFTLTDSVDTVSVEVLSESDLTPSDWAGVGQWTDFACNGTKVEGKVPTNYYVKENGSWSEVNQAVAMKAIVDRLS